MAGLSLTPSGAADAGAFLARLVRLDSGAVVRLRPGASGAVEVWGRVPWDVLVTRSVSGVVSHDVVVSADELLASLGGSLPPRRDAAWQWALPPGGGQVAESLPAAHVRSLGVAAASTVRATAATRAVRDALLDHVAIVVETTVRKSTVERVDVPQRLVQAVVRMSFLRSNGDSPEPPVRVLVSGRFVGLAGEYGVAWYRPSPGLDVRAIVRSAEPG